MGLFDEVRAVSISHKNFNHNGYTFQTKDLDCAMLEYCVIDNVLHQETFNCDGEYKCHDRPLRLDYSGQLNIYTDTVENDTRRWIEYNLTFKDGELISLEPLNAHT